MRVLWEELIKAPFGGNWYLAPCDWNPDYYELLHWYPEELKLIGKGTQGQVFL